MENFISFIDNYTVEIIDQLGGLTVDVDRPMHYVDYAGGLFVDLQPGVQKLSGRAAMGYLRYRHDGGDFKRIDRQQRFMNAMANELLNHRHVLQSPQLFLTLLSYLDTNLNTRETLGLSFSLRAAYGLGRMQFSTLPGSDMMVDGIYYWKPRPSEIEPLLEKFRSHV